MVIFHSYVNVYQRVHPKNDNWIVVPYFQFPPRPWFFFQASEQKEKQGIVSRGNSRNGEYALQHCHFLWSQLSDNDDHRIFWGIIVLLGRGTPKNRPTTSWSRLSLETGAILFGYVTYPATKKCPFPSNLLFSYTEKCWNHHHSITISLNIFPPNPMHTAAAGVLFK